jgi:hypothetical protein
MQEFINQAKHNHVLHDSICEKYKETYYDWKITCLFYVAIHYLKALAKKRKKDIGSSHMEINNNIRTGTHNPSMAIQDTARQNYMNLFHYSQTARYEGFKDLKTFNILKKKDYEHSLECFNQFKKFIITNQVPIE